MRTTLWLALFALIALIPVQILAFFGSSWLILSLAATSLLGFALTSVIDKRFPG